MDNNKFAEITKYYLGLNLDNLGKIVLLNLLNEADDDLEIVTSYKYLIEKCNSNKSSMQHTIFFLTKEGLIEKYRDRKILLKSGNFTIKLMYDENNKKIIISDNQKKFMKLVKDAIADDEKITYDHSGFICYKGDDKINIPFSKKTINRNIMEYFKLEYLHNKTFIVKKSKAELIKNRTLVNRINNRRFIGNFFGHTFPIDRKLEDLRKQYKLGKIDEDEYDEMKENIKNRNVYIEVREYDCELSVVSKKIRISLFMEQTEFKKTI